MKWIIGIMGTVLLGGAFVYIRFSLRFSRNRKSVIKQTGEKWYRLAWKEVFSERGQQFLHRHLAETCEPDRVRIESERPFAQTAALGVYLRSLDEKGKDAAQYDTLPLDEEALAHARVLSRVAIRSWLWKDNIG